jgi:hypothetical protein
MDRYVFYAVQPVDAKVVTAAKKTAAALGATVVRTVAGSMLLEAPAAKAAQVAKALPGWRYSVETKTHRLPERTPLQRARAARAAKKAA